MRSTFIVLLFIGLLFGLSSCFELIEDTTLNNDGSGTYKLTLNLSASTTKINSLMAMDSIKGEKVPSRTEIGSKLSEYLALLEKKEGISDVKAVLNTDNWILNLSLDFKSLTALKKGLIALSEEINKKEANSAVNGIVLKYVDNKYQRKIGSLIPADWQEKARENEDFAKLSEGKCVFIQRFEKEIVSVSSEDVRIAKNKKAAMLQLSPLMLVNAPELLDYTIITNQ